MLHFSPWKTFIILAVCCLGILLVIPNFLGRETLSRLPEWARPVNLGLDLQGGSHLLLEVDVQSGLKDQFASLVDGVRTILREQKVRYTSLRSTDKGISFKLHTLEKEDDVRRTLRRDMPDYDVDSKNGFITLTLTNEARDRKTSQMVNQSIEIVRRRIDEYGTSEPDIQQQSSDRIQIQLPGVGDPARIKQLLGKTAKLSYRMVHPQSHALIQEGRVPLGYEKLESLDRDDEAFYIVEKRIILSGENLENATVSNDAQTNQPVVSITFDTQGARRFGKITTEQTGHQLAIVLDNKVISAPVLTEPILGGHAQISGRFSFKDASDLAILMRSGAMPAPLRVLEERTVGPSLGADSIEAGKTATILSVILVSICMLLAYSFFGILANIALIFNLILIFAAMSVMGNTLTLPGIAGIALTLGTAVDANILIYERIKEELREGASYLQALDRGYERASATVTDSNLTTLIGSVALFIFGSGPVRGFAVTLTIGTIASMFTAILLTRFMVVHWMRWRRPKKLYI